VRNEAVLHRVKEVRNIVHTAKRSEANWIGHILRRNCILKHVTEGKKEGRLYMRGRRGNEVSSYWKMLRKADNTVNLKTKY
jgi:hypothetical protein